MEKSADAFRTISEVSEILDTPAHVLRFWESRFPQIKPVKRAGGRRYYRPSDVALLGGIKRLLHDDGLTIRGVQKVLREQGIRHVAGLTRTVGTADAALLPAETVAEDPPEAKVPKARAAPGPKQAVPRRPVAALPDSAAGPSAEPLPLWAAAVERVGNRAAAPPSSPAPRPASKGTPAEADVWLPALLRALPTGQAAERRERLVALHARLLALRNRVADAARRSQP